MELSSVESIRAALRLHGRSALVRRHRGAQDANRPVSNDRRIRCQCGRCQQCLDNARWERIFAEKFADPNYYTRRVVRYTSPLTSL
jgi:hypothetical protein